MKLLWTACAFSLGVLAAGATVAATLVHDYSFDDGTANDGVGSLNGTTFGGATISGGLLQLDGVDDYVELSGYAVPTSGGDFSVVMRAQAETPLAGNYVEMISQGFSGSPGFYLGHDPSGMIRITDNYFATGLAFPADAEFHTYVLTSGDLFGTQLYIDGINVFSNAELNIGAGGEFTRFGRQFDPFSEFFKGSIDYVQIYDGELEGGTLPPAVPLPAGLPLFIAALIPFVMLRRRT